MRAIEELYSLKGKTALITGGSRGLGKQMALAFAKAGAEVIIVSRKIDACEEVANEIIQQGGKAYPYAAHIGRWEQIDQLIDELYEKFTKIDILVNNAGMSPLYDKLVNVNEKLWDSVLSLNLKGPFRLSSLIGERMANGDGGSIINISSIAAINPTKYEAPYGAAKAGLNALTLSLAEAYGPKVRVNCIMAGPFLTDVSKHWDMEVVMQKFAERSPLQRPGNPDEIIGSAIYFASDASSYSTGSILALDGGFKR